VADWRRSRMRLFETLKHRKTAAAVKVDHRTILQGARPTLTFYQRVYSVTIA
jgi:hypothetical protein